VFCVFLVPHWYVYNIIFLARNSLGRQITLCRDGMENYVQMDDRNQRKTGFTYMYGPVLQVLKFLKASCSLSLVRPRYAGTGKVMDALIFLLCFCNPLRFGLHKTRFNAENWRWTAHSYNHSPYNNDDQTHKTREILNKLHTRKKQKGLEDKTQAECTDFFVAIVRQQRKSTKSYTNTKS